MKALKALNAQILRVVSGSVAAISGGCLIISSEGTGIVLLSAGALLACRELLVTARDLQRDLQRQAKLIRLLDVKAPSAAEAARALKGDEQLIVAVYYQNGQLTATIVGHKSERVWAQLQASGETATMAQVISRADRGLFKLVGV